MCKSGDISPGHIWTTLYVSEFVIYFIRALRDALIQIDS